ncbi:MAG: energy-coupling factor ABC transporter substrate-binding protein [Methanimicrococcus sp.]|nr:energy-coupling factor ABC transporter substrate-binding protein [Methanimicrococcus sp.]
MSSFKVEYILIAALIIFAAVFVYQTMINDSEFEGADGAASDFIYEINPDYTPIAEPLWEPPGTETESLLFAIQGVIGAFIIGLFFGHYRAVNKFKKQNSKV